jgi:hypothetical protein
MLDIYYLVHEPGSTVSIVTRLRKGKAKNRISFLGVDGCFSSSTTVQILGSTQPSVQKKPRVLPLGIKQLGHEDSDSPPPILSYT